MFRSHAINIFALRAHDCPTATWGAKAVARNPDWTPRCGPQRVREPECSSTFRRDPHTLDCSMLALGGSVRGSGRLRHKISYREGFAAGWVEHKGQSVIRAPACADAAPHARGRIDVIDAVAHAQCMELAV
jgi:hypothetical protein